MSVRTFFPTDLLSLLFVVLLIGWFAFWLRRLQLEAAILADMGLALKRLDGCVDQLRTHQLWRDRRRIQGEEASVDPGTLFEQACATELSGGGAIPLILQSHFRAIFVAGCDESSLDSAELNAQTCQEIGNKSGQLRNELILVLLLGALGTLLMLSRQAVAYVTSSMANQRAFPPLIWGLLLTIAGGILYLRHQRESLEPVLSALRRKTTALWIPRLYPTVAQRAAQWAIHTLHNAARVTDASEVIETHATRFVSSIESARSAAEMFSAGMREFSRGLEGSEHALENAQTRLVAEIAKFSDSLGRWGKFEDEIRRFYSVVEGHQRQIVNEQKTFEAMLSGYYDLVRQSTIVLQQAAAQVGAAAGSLPAAFQTSAEAMKATTTEVQLQLSRAIADLGGTMTTAYRQESEAMQARLQELVQPVMNMEDRLRALGTPFETASNNLTEVATNLWRLNDSFAREIRQTIAEAQSANAKPANLTS